MSKGRRQWNRDAIEWYTKALDEKCGDARRNSVFLGNRAQAHLNIKNYRSAFDDAQAADPADPHVPHTMPGAPRSAQLVANTPLTRLAACAADPTHARTPVCTQTISSTRSERRG